MIALQQPVSQDLRTVLTVLKAVSDLERMGDHAVSIAKAAIRMKGSNVSQLLKKKSREWGAMSRTSLKQPLNSISMVPVDQAYEVAAMDEKNQPLLW